MVLRWIWHRLFNLFVVASIIANLSAAISPGHAQETKTKIRIANSAMSVTSLALLAARDWKLFYERALEPEIILMSPTLTVPAMISGEIDYFAGVGPGVASASLSGLPFRAVWVSSDRVSYSLVANPKFKTLQDLKGKKIGVSFGGSTFAGTKAVLELYKMNPDKDVQYVSIPGSQPKIAALQQGIIQAALLAPPSDYVAVKAGFKRLVNLADLFKDTSFSGLAATGKTIRENPQFVKRMVRAVVRGVIHSRDYPEDAIQTMMKHWHMDRDVSVDAYKLVREALNPVPTEKGVELMAHWQSIALNVPPKRPARDYMDLRFVKEVMAELEKK